MDGLPFCLYMDRLSVHLCVSVKQKMDELRISAVLNVAYSPQYNPIEECFAIVKNHYKRERLNCLRNDKPILYQQMIKRAFAAVSREHVHKFITNSHTALKV